MKHSVTLFAACLLTLSACGEKGERPAAQPPSPPAPPPSDSLAPPAATAESVARRAAAPSPWSPDKDTTGFIAVREGDISQVPTCETRTPRITRDSIGPFRLNQTIADLRTRCPRLLFGWVMISDGYSVPSVAARLGGATITAFVDDTLPTSTTTRVELQSPGPTTAQGLGVGSTLRQLQAAYGAPGASESDCVLRVWFDPLPGIAFHLVYPASAPRECGALSEMPLPPDLKVASVILVAQ
jgi:hypothetical protein